MNILLHVSIVAGVFLFMEFVAWFTHKYIMHGFLWVWHESHHKVRKGIFEKNDLFALVFSVPSIGLIFYSTFYMGGYSYVTSIGIGIACYGLFYFIFHDIIVHRRIKIRFKARSRYMRRIMHAHYVHHKKHTKEGGEAFGFLYAPRKYEPDNAE